MSTINSDEHYAEHGVRSGREQPLVPEHREAVRQNRGVLYVNRKPNGKASKAM